MLDIIKEYSVYLIKYIWLINIFLIMIVILFERQNPVYTMFWIVILLLAPYLGFILYLFFGISFRKKRRANRGYERKLLKSKKIIKSSARKDLFKWSKLINYLEMALQSPISKDTIVTTYIDGDSYFNDLKHELKSAKEIINLEVYLLRYDNLGKEICDILIERSKSGVEVNLIVDGANYINPKMLLYLKKNKVNIKIFFQSVLPFLHMSLRANYRNHKKSCIIDHKMAYVGGFNIGDDYLGKGRLGNWRDTAIKVLGDVVLEIEKEFYFSLNIISKKMIDYKVEKYKYPELVFKNIMKKKGKHTGYTQVVSSGPNYEFRTLRDTYLNMIQEAEEYIFIQTPYFVPDDTLLDALRIAALSGVKIKIMIPKEVDHFFVYWINRYFIGELIDFGVEIYEYNNGFLHCKTIVVDSEVVSIGSGNFDYRSFYQSFEMNVLIYEKDVATLFKETFYRDLRYSSKISLKDYYNRSIYEKICESVFRLLAPVV